MGRQHHAQQVHIGNEHHDGRERDHEGEDGFGTGASRHFRKGDARLPAEGSQMTNAVVSGSTQAAKNDAAMSPTAKSASA